MSLMSMDFEIIFLKFVCFDCFLKNFSALKIKNILGLVQGPFISKSDSFDQVQFSETCSPHKISGKNLHVHVKCTPMKCGIATGYKVHGEYERRKYGDISFESHRWPFVVAIYKEGNFICSGTIVTPTCVSKCNQTQTKLAIDIFILHC